MRNLRRFLAVLVAVTVMLTAAVPAFAQDLKSAPEMLVDLGVIKASQTTDSYLAKSAQKIQVATLQLRLLELEGDARSYTGKSAYKDKVSGTNKKILGYLKSRSTDLGWPADKKGLFNPTAKVSGVQVYKALLRVLGYKPGKDFEDSEVAGFAKALGMKKFTKKTSMTMQNVFDAIVEAMKAPVKGGSGNTLAVEKSIDNPGFAKAAEAIGLIVVNRIESVTAPAAMTVAYGATVSLPSKVLATTTFGYLAQVDVKWEAVDNKKPGKVTVKGTIDGFDAGVTVDVTIADKWAVISKVELSTYDKDSVFATTDKDLDSVAAKDFVVEQTIFDGTETKTYPLTVANVVISAKDKKMMLISFEGLKELTVNEFDQWYTIDVTYKGDKVSSDKVSLAKYSWKVEEVTAKDGEVKAFFDQAPMSVPVVADFILTKSVDGGAAENVAVNEFIWDAATNTATFAVDEIEKTQEEQTVVYTVKYKEDAAVAAEELKIDVAGTVVTVKAEVTASTAIPTIKSVKLLSAEGAVGAAMFQVITSDYTYAAKSIGTAQNINTADKEVTVKILTATGAVLATGKLDVSASNANASFTVVVPKTEITKVTITADVTASAAIPTIKSVKVTSAAGVFGAAQFQVITSDYSYTAKNIGEVQNINTSDKEVTIKILTAGGAVITSGTLNVEATKAGATFEVDVPKVETVKSTVNAEVTVSTAIPTIKSVKVVSALGVAGAAQFQVVTSDYTYSAKNIGEAQNINSSDKTVTIKLLSAGGAVITSGTLNVEESNANATFEVEAAPSQAKAYAEVTVSSAIPTIKSVKITAADVAGAAQFQVITSDYTYSAKDINSAQNINTGDTTVTVKILAANGTVLATGTLNVEASNASASFDVR